jgi:transposase
MEERRMRAADLFEQGVRPAEIARQLGVWHQIVSDWRAAWRRSGRDGLRAAGRAGRLPKLSPEQLADVEVALAKGAEANGYPNDMWTLQRAAEVIERVTGVSYHPARVWYILRYGLRWTWQRPARQATERNDEAIQRWVKKRWPPRPHTPTLMETTERRNKLRQTFNQAAELYDRMRPTYPDAAFEDLAAYGPLEVGSRILEICCGMGQATLSLAMRGYRVTGIELGADMASVASRKLADFADVEVIVSDFESWPLPAQPFAIVSATAFHWIDPTVRVHKSAAALHGGVFWPSSAPNISPPATRDSSKRHRTAMNAGTQPRHRVFACRLQLKFRLIRRSLTPPASSSRRTHAAMSGRRATPPKPTAISC